MKDSMRKNGYSGLLSKHSTMWQVSHIFGLISKYSAVISDTFILYYFNILDSKAEHSDITVQSVQYLYITTEYIKSLSNSWIYIFCVFFQGHNAIQRKMDI